MIQYRNKIRLCFDFDPWQRVYPWSGTIDWGDGSSDAFTASNPTSNCIEHIYEDDKEYTITVDLENRCAEYKRTGIKRVDGNITWN